MAGGGRAATGQYFSEFEVYDPASAALVSRGDIDVTRFPHTATLLPSGKVLLAGGRSPDGATDSAEVYDPSTGASAAVGSMTTPRSEHIAALLPSGLVLLAGGFDGRVAHPDLLPTGRAHRFVVDKPMATVVRLVLAGLLLGTVSCRDASIRAAVDRNDPSAPSASSSEGIYPPIAADGERGELTGSGEPAATPTPSTLRPPVTAAHASVPGPAVAGTVAPLTGNDRVETPSASNGYCKIRGGSGVCIQHCYPSPSDPNACLGRPHGQTAPRPPRR